MAEVFTERGKKVISTGLLSFVLGMGIGVLAESHTDEIARGKVVTAEACRKEHPNRDEITQEFIDCISDGVPGGEPIGSDAMKVGHTPVEIDTYIAAQKNEQGIEPGRIVLWGIAGQVFDVADIVL